MKLAKATVRKNCKPTSRQVELKDFIESCSGATAENGAFDATRPVDQEDIRALAEQGLVSADAVQKRAEEALGGYVGEMTRIKNSIKLAYKLIDAVQSKRTRKNKKKSP